MSTQHKNISEVDLHETKGASTAAANTVHVANGSGVTSWTKVGPTNIDTSTVKNINVERLSIQIDAPNGTFTTYLPLPFGGTLTGVIGALDGLPSASALNITIYNDTTLLATLTFPTSGTLPLIQDPVVSSTGNVFTSGTAIKIVNASGIASSGKLKLVFTLTL